jgi:hypothetical protein
LFEAGKPGWNSIMKTLYLIPTAVGGVAVMLAAAAMGQIRLTAPSRGPKVEAVADANGNLHVPDGYRTTYQFLGSWAVASDPGRGSKNLHVVYASPGAIAAYRRSARFPDGTTLVKEVFQTATAEMTTGTVSRAASLQGWFVMVKDSVGRHAANKLWGDGWGWSWFDAADASKTTSTDYKTNCLSCHVPARESDWVYVDGYPPLKR